MTLNPRLAPVDSDRMMNQTLGHASGAKPPFPCALPLQCRNLYLPFPKEVIRGANSGNPTPGGSSSGNPSVSP